jgi:hypothetical protein
MSLFMRRIPATLLLMAGALNCATPLRADSGFLDSLEWKVALADFIGVCTIDQITGPNPGADWSQLPYTEFTAHFKLEQPLRGSPPATFTRYCGIWKDKTFPPEFTAGDTYIFFLVAPGCEMFGRKSNQLRMFFVHGRLCLAGKAAVQEIEQMG